MSKKNNAKFFDKKKDMIFQQSYPFLKFIVKIIFQICNFNANISLIYYALQIFYFHCISVTVKIF